MYLIISLRTLLLNLFQLAAECIKSTQFCHVTFTQNILCMENDRETTHRKKQVVALINFFRHAFFNNFLQSKH